MECDDYDAAPLPIKKDRFREKWDCLSRDATNQLLNQLHPRLAISGHVHHGCTKKLPVGDGLEITVPSFSWRNKENPTYSLVSLETYEHKHFFLYTRLQVFKIKCFFPVCVYTK